MEDVIVSSGACLLTAAGWLALARMCPTRGRSSTLAMLHCCAIGMLAGFIIDARDGRFTILTSLCVSGDRSLLYWTQLHWNQLPAMHAGMVLGSLLALPMQPLAHLRLRTLLTEAVKTIACMGVMLAGMNLGALALAAMSDGTPPAHDMLAGMALGMVWSLLSFTAIIGALDRRRSLQRCDFLFRYLT